MIPHLVRLPPLVLFVASIGLLLVVRPGPAGASDVGQIKVSKGTVHIERAGQKLPVAVGAKVREGDVVVTGPSAVGHPPSRPPLRATGGRRIMGTSSQCGT